MKHKLNVTLAVLFAALIGTAYATCYLHQVVLCAAASDDLGTFDFGTCTPNGTDYHPEAYAYENGYKFAVYTVTRGGFGSKTVSPNYCNADPNCPTPSTFRIWFLDPCTGSTALTDTGTALLNFGGNDINTTSCN